MKAVGVSATTGMGMEDLFCAIDESKEEYYEFYYKEIEQRAKASLRSCTLLIINLKEFA